MRQLFPISILFLTFLMLATSINLTYGDTTTQIVEDYGSEEDSELDKEDDSNTIQSEYSTLRLKNKLLTYGTAILGTSIEVHLNVAKPPPKVV